MHRNRPASGVEGPPARRGRIRDDAIDARILAAAKRQLSVLGYEAMSLASVAQEAGTTRQALYRRWGSKAELADAAVASISETAAQPRTAAAPADPFTALVAEFTDFQRGVSRPGRLSLVGTMLQETTDPEVRERYRAKVIHPRRARIAAILERAAELGQIDPGADLAVAVTMGTGAWYARALAGDDVPADWPRRAAELVWRAVGGQVPSR